MPLETVIDREVRLPTLVRLLGPVDLLVDDHYQLVRGPRRAAILAALALHAGDVVGIDRLVDIVWGEAAPATAAATVHSHMWQLRRLPGLRERIVARTPGYLLDVDGVATDVQTARRLIRRGGECTRLSDRVRLLNEAVGLWRGRPLATVGDAPWFDQHARRLDDELLRARHALLEARLALGEHGHLVRELETLCRQHPLHEQFHGQLMLALYRADRRADALATYRRLRDTLSDELGIDPSPPLQDLQAAILGDEQSVRVPSNAVLATHAAARPIPTQLPKRVGRFVGRDQEMARLDALGRRQLGPANGSDAATVVVIAGSPGVGKSTLAVHWAHQVAHRFPDGQLFVNLRGFDPKGAVVDAAEALSVFLDALSVPAEQIPADLDAQVDLYRSLLAGRRMLVLLDNARTAEQVRPLLPAAPGCLVLITSRVPMDSVADRPAELITLDLLTDAEAADLLAFRIGSARTSAEPDAVQEIIRHCARLPLALGIAAARAAAHPHFPLAETARELREAASTLDALESGDRASDLRAVFACSYRTLSRPAASLFRLLGLHPGRDITGPAAASLAGTAPAEVGPRLDELVRAHLITQHAPGRFAFHDLLRSYAIEQAHLEEDGATLRAATGRILDHYLHSAYAHASLAEKDWYDITLHEPAPGVSAETPRDRQAAVAWLEAERSVLLSAIGLAAGTGRADLAWKIAWPISTYLLRRGHWHDVETAHRTALAACERAGNLSGQAHALYGLASGVARSGRSDDEARPLFLTANDLFARAGDILEQGRVHSMLAWMAERRGDPADALREAQRGLALHRAVGDRTGEAESLGDVGWCHALLGDYDNAITSCREALGLQRELGHRVAEAATWDSLGFIHRQLGDSREAVRCYEHAIRLYRDLSDRYNEAAALDGLGDSHYSAGDLVTARQAWQTALTILDALNHPDAHGIRSKLEPSNG